MTWFLIRSRYSLCKELSPSTSIDKMMGCIGDCVALSPDMINTRLLAARMSFSARGTRDLMINVINLLKYGAGDSINYCLCHLSSQTRQLNTGTIVRDCGRVTLQIGRCVEAMKLYFKEFRNSPDFYVFSTWTLRRMPSRTILASCFHLLLVLSC